MRALVLHGRIKTTEQKGKAIKGEIETYITKAKKLGEGSRYHLSQHFSPDVTDKIIKDIAPRFLERSGGYVRLLKLSPRIKDNASMVVMEWVEGEKIKDQKSNIKNEEVKIAKEKVEENRTEVKESNKLAKSKKSVNKNSKKKKDEKTNRTNKNK